MRPDEAHLAVALGVVAHRGDHQVDAVLADHRDAGGGVDAVELHLDAEPFGDGVCNVDLVAGPLVTLACREQRIVVAHADPDTAAAQHLGQPVGRLGAVRARLRLRPPSS